MMVEVLQLLANPKQSQVSNLKLQALSFLPLLALQLLFSCHLCALQVDQVIDSLLKRKRVSFLGALAFHFSCLPTIEMPA
jgi:hypothetical protein